MTKFAAIAGLVLILLLIVSTIIHWSPSRTLHRKQVALEKAIDSKKTTAFKNLIADSYKDRWDYTAEDLALTMVDIRSQYIILNIVQDSPLWTREGKTADLAVRYLLDGQPKTPAAGFITLEANKLQTPHIFTWEKQSIWPWSWKLTSYNNSSVPDDAFGYTPGDLSKTIENLEEAF